MYKIKNNKNKYLGGVFVSLTGSLEFIFVEEESANLYNDNDTNVLVYILNRYYNDDNIVWTAVVVPNQTEEVKNDK